MITRLAKRTRLRSATAIATKPPKECPTRWTRPPLALRMNPFQRISLVGDGGIMCGAAFCGSPVSEQACGHAAKRVWRAAIKGRHAAPVLHDPGASTTVGPDPQTS